ncbi:MAG: hypothetical protein J7623_26815 [Chitinophaga sp.]|uniref:hypothetical protein n=1 Tax=Chitinophaga sp. TaxID=1869181 RepID=UPI001B2653DA|nr:hypothetical protein [Chitinophaga sp.]MBO9732283.1 hypothetical protein [Chitinophaga sp.]
MYLFKRFLLAVLFFPLFSCSSRQQEVFVKKYGHGDFTAFTNRCVYFRGRDKERSLILFIDNDLSVSGSNGPFIVYVNRDLKTVVKTSTRLMADTTNIDKVLLQQLAIRFLSYKVNILKVDTLGNVFIGLLNSERPDLIRFSNEKYKTIYYKDGWSNVKENWYRSNE